MTISRRTGLQWAAAATVPTLLAQPSSAEVLNVSQADLLAMKLRSDGITLDFPSLADTGASIPMDVAIVAPGATTITMIEIFLPENPNTRALTMKLIAPRERFTFSTRLRLAGSQDAWVVVNFSDGSRRGARAPTVVTSSACFDAS